MMKMAAAAVLIFSLSPESMMIENGIGRSSGLVLFEHLPVRIEQWLEDPTGDERNYLTATGIAPDLHRLPF